jgi:hypothetical protein
MRFAGVYPLACGERVWPLAYPDAALYASRLLATLWRDAGGRLGGSVREGPAPEGVKPSFEITRRRWPKWCATSVQQQRDGAAVAADLARAPARARPRGRREALRAAGERLGER